MYFERHFTEEQVKRAVLSQVASAIPNMWWNVPVSPGYFLGKVGEEVLRGLPYSRTHVPDKLYVDTFIVARADTPELVACLEDLDFSPVQV